MDLIDLLAGLGIGVGLVGVVVPLMPGTVLIGLSVLVWAAVTGTGGGWLAATIALVLLALGAVTKYVLPGRRLQENGVPTRALIAGGLLGLIGFFVVPVVGLVIGFVLGIYLTEVARTSHAQAWPATVHALKAVGLGIVIELGFGLGASAVWLVGALST